MLSVRPSVRTYIRPHFSNLEKQNKQKTMFATGVTMDLAEWIIDDTCRLLLNWKLKKKKQIG